MMAFILNTGSYWYPFIFIYCVLTFIAIAANHHQEDKEMQDELKKTQREAGFAQVILLKNAQQ